MPRRALNPRNHNLEPLINASAQRAYRREQLEAEARIEIDRKMAEVDARYFAELLAADRAMVANTELQRKTGKSYGVIRNDLEEARTRHEMALTESNVPAPLPSAPGAAPQAPKRPAQSAIFRILNGWTLPIDPAAVDHEHGPDVEISISGLHLPPGAREGQEVSGTAKVQVRNNVGNPAMAELPLEIQQRAVLRPIEGDPALVARLGTSVIHQGSLSAEMWAWLTGGAS